jgi:phosphoribosylanthranilate isomerase
MICRLKICGVTNAEDAQAAAELGAQYLGFNFYSKSPRRIEPVKAREIIDMLDESVIPVGIFVGADDDEVMRIVQLSRIGVAQIYHPSPDLDLKRIGLPIIYAMAATPENLKRLTRLRAGIILLDSPAGSMPGGTGNHFDWSLIPQDFPRERLALAGGINPANIRMALRQVRPAIIDVASGAEISPGKKNLDKIRQLMEAINEYNSEARINVSNK